MHDFLEMDYFPSFSHRFFFEMPSKTETHTLSHLTSLFAVRCIPMQEMTRGSCVVGWVQLDNQTIDPVAPVVVAPTMVEHPQATLQMSFIRNNIKSHSHLNHFEVINTTSRFPHYFVAFCSSVRVAVIVVSLSFIGTAGLVQSAIDARTRMLFLRVSPYVVLEQ